MAYTGIRSWLQQVVFNWQHKRRHYQALNYITIHKDNVLHNVRLLKRRHPGMHIVPVLKANAYGHGLREIARILNDAPCPLLAVDGYFEAGKIRFITTHRILVLGYVLPSNVPLLDTKRCSFVVQDQAVLEAFGHLGKPVKVHLEINTGMNRLGIMPDEVQSYLTALKQFSNLELEGVMTHLADADNEIDDRYTERQVELFDACMADILAAGFMPKYVHIAQTAGSTKARSRYANAIRLGIGLYGINPLTEKDSRHDSLGELKPVLSLTSTIIKAIDLAAGERVSYNGTFTAGHAMRIGVLPLGYYEGIPRSFSNTGFVMSGSTRLPIVGRVCMNHTMIDLGSTSLSTGDVVTVYAEDTASPNSITALCRTHHLFPYELLVQLSSSIRRLIS
jgi:alanine racemase